MSSTRDQDISGQRMGRLGFPEALRGKRILLATESFGPVNGVSRTTLNLVNYLRENGVELAVVAPEISASEPIVLKAHKNEIEVRLHGYPVPYSPELSVVYPVRLSSLYRRTFDTPPNLIYLASPASLGFQILLQLRHQQNPVPVLLNFQTDLSGYCEILFPHPLDRWAVWVFGSVQGYLFRHPSVRAVFYPSLFVRRYLEKSGVQSEKMVNLRRGVNCELFNPSKRSESMRKTLAPNGDIILTCVSRLAPEKGFKFLADTVRRLIREGFKFHLLIVGGNKNPAVVQDIKDMFEPVRDEVTFTGELRGEKLAEAYACGDIFLHCSITETFGLVVLESMASGVPVVARDEGGPSEIVADGRSGYLVAPMDLDAFVSRVRTLGVDIALRERMANESRRMAEAATWETINKQVAWKMAEALEDQAVQMKDRVARNDSIIVCSRLPLYSGIRGSLETVVTMFKVMGCMGIISGAWAGLAVTYVMVQSSLWIRTKIPWFEKVFRRKME